MACWNMFIPYLVPDLPAKQKEALAYGVKGPLVYTSVAVKNWTAFQKLGVSNVNAPTMYHTGVSLAEAVSLGDLQHPQSPDEPDRAAHDAHAVRAGQTAQGAASDRPRRSAEHDVRDLRAKASAISSRECWAPAASIRRATSSRSP